MSGFPFHQEPLFITYSSVEKTGHPKTHLERLTFRDVKSPQEFRHGETAEVVCDVISSPVPVVVWYYQDKEITEEHHSRFQVLQNNNLQIRQVTKADEGVYRCEASVEARGEIDFVDIAVVVNVHNRAVIFCRFTRVGAAAVLTEINVQSRFSDKDAFKVAVTPQQSATGNKDESEVALALVSFCWLIKRQAAVDWVTGTPCVLLTALTQRLPPSLSVFQQSFNATADYQESVTFTCITSGSPDPLVTWHRKGQQLEPSEKYIFSQLEGGRSMLTIRNIRQADGGTFSCKASNKAGFQERDLLLKVFVQPHITQLKNVTAVEGSAAMISCVAEGEPLPDISWRRASDGQTFVDGDKVDAARKNFVFVFQSRDGRFEVRGRHGKSVLTISGVRLSDLGRFDCEAQSRIGGHQKSMFLDIEYIPKFLTNHTIYYSWEGNPVNISCDVMSNPPATMLWRRERFTISEGTPHMQIYGTDGKSVLEVTPMSDRDFGRYNCTARNNIGVRYQEFILAQADVPSNPYSVRLSAVSQRLATVTFMKPDSHGGVPISFYLVQYKELGSLDWRDVKSHSVQTTVVLTGLEPNTTYEVRVAAVNGKGQGEFSHTETFQTLPIREPSPPAVHGQRGVGKAYRLGLVKQDDGGMPIVEYIVKYKTDKEEQWMTKLVPGANDFAMLQPLQWNTRYEVEITARNVKGLSEPTFYQFFMPQKPDITGKSMRKPVFSSVITAAAKWPAGVWARFSARKQELGSGELKAPNSGEPGKKPKHFQHGAAQLKRPQVLLKFNFVKSSFSIFPAKICLFFMEKRCGLVVSCSSKSDFFSHQEVMPALIAAGSQQVWNKSSAASHSDEQAPFPAQLPQFNWQDSWSVGTPQPEENPLHQMAVASYFRMHRLPAVQTDLQKVNFLKFEIYLEIKITFILEATSCTANKVAEIERMKMKKQRPNNGALWYTTGQHNENKVQTTETNTKTSDRMLPLRKLTKERGVIPLPQTEPSLIIKFLFLSPSSNIVSPSGLRHLKELPTLLSDVLPSV
ncbi:hypothetical protein CCH79_00017219 [Gambusia affinis]|uniref:Neural cell adhesion molecule 2 n=1 Tax=Gambusia affinis TaxID=33528 RepID=A0A315WCP3_GAMAF|nr:hypothetical protein CCH79_00017219 [Gambusia affinis]